jgi:sarcosine oxidase subunit gamma
MLEPRSPLAAVYAVGRLGIDTGPTSVTVFERANCGLLQISGWPDSFAAVVRQLATILKCEVPANCTEAVSQGELTVFRVGPERLWLAGAGDDTLRARIEETLPPQEVAVTDLGHSRTVLRILGPGIRVLLSRGLPIDLDERTFARDAFAQSIIHHVPVLVHRVDAQDEAAFDIYIPRDLAASFWGWLVAAAAPLGARVVEPR